MYLQKIMSRTGTNEKGAKKRKQLTFRTGELTVCFAPNARATRAIYGLLQKKRENDCKRA
jgi:hypothetical protein